MTMSEDLEKRLVELEDCFGQLETDVDWFRFNSERRIFETVKKAPIKGQDSNWGALHLLCPENTVYFIKFRIHVTK